MTSLLRPYPRPRTPLRCVPLLKQGFQRSRCRKVSPQKYRRHLLLEKMSLLRSLYIRPPVLPRKRTYPKGRLMSVEYCDKSKKKPLKRKNCLSIMKTPYEFTKLKGRRTQRNFLNWIVTYKKQSAEAFHMMTSTQNSQRWVGRRRSL